MLFCGDLKFQKNIISLNLINVTIRTLILMLKNHLKNPYIFHLLHYIIFRGFVKSTAKVYIFQQILKDFLYFFRSANCFTISSKIFSN